MVGNGDGPDRGDARHPALAIVISGAPGSGKTTLARALSEEMKLPHLNKDLVTASLLRSGLPYEVANKRAFKIIYGTAATWLDASMSLIVDMTMYAAYSPSEVGTLRPHGVVVHVHTRCSNSLQRWEDKIRRTLPEPEANAVIERGRAIHEEVTEPLDFNCPRIEVDTQDGYKPDLRHLMAAIESAHHAVSS